MYKIFVKNVFNETLKNLPQMLKKSFFFQFFQYKEYIVSQKYYNSAKQFKTVIWKTIENWKLYMYFSDRFLILTQRQNLLRIIA